MARLRDIQKAKTKRNLEHLRNLEGVVLSELNQALEHEELLWR